MKSTACLMTICSTLLLTGCLGRDDPVAVEKPVAAFCDVEEPRRFSQAEIEWRAANAPWNLRRDYKTNKTWDRECKPVDPD